MIRQTKFRAIAEAELTTAMAWYEDQRPGLGNELQEDVQEVLDVIVRKPNRFPIIEDDTRQAPLVRYPYCIYYRVLPDRVQVTGIVHNARDPSVWRGRR